MSIYKKYTLLVHEGDEGVMNATTLQNILNLYFQGDLANEEDFYAKWGSNRVLDVTSEEVDGPSLG